MALWLVTGGAGFIGSNLVEALVSRGEQVRVLDNFSTGLRQNLESIPGPFELMAGDVRDPEICGRAAAGVDYILHQAALGSVPRSIANPLETHAANATGTLTLLVAARGEKVKRFVCAGSSSVYGRNPALPKREDMVPMPISPYAVSKLAQENYCLAFTECYGLETVVLRYFNIYGPRQDPSSLYAAVIPKFLKAALEGRSPEIHGDGEQSRDFTFVADCVEANLAAATAPLNSQRVFNIAGGRRVSINQIWQEIKRITGTRIEAKHVEPRPGDVRHSLADTTQASQVLGWKPQVGIAEGLARTRQAFKPGES
jgi:nucleoside-diphosphate-sugar epimerase